MALMLRKNYNYFLYNDRLYAFEHMSEAAYIVTKGLSDDSIFYVTIRRSEVPVAIRKEMFEFTKKKVWQE